MCAVLLAFLAEKYYSIIKQITKGLLSCPVMSLCLYLKFGIFTAINDTVVYLQCVYNQ